MALARRLSETDLDTLKRAGEVQLLDRYESEAAKNYAEAIAALASAVEAQPHAYLAAKNVLLLKTVNSSGEPVVVSRVLTPHELALFQAGELRGILAEPAQALTFLQTGAIPAPHVSSRPPQAIDPTIQN